LVRKPFPGASMTSGAVGVPTSTAHYVVAGPQVAAHLPSLRGETITA
jgi:hypothetical protein